MHKDKQYDILLQMLAEGHTVTAACRKAGISRMTYHRLRKSNPAFRGKVEEALLEGKCVNDDIAITSHMAQIKDKKWPATKYYLNHHVAPYKQSAAQTKQEAAEREHLRLQVLEFLGRNRPIEKETRDRIVRAFSNWGISLEDTMITSLEAVVRQDDIDAKTYAELKAGLEDIGRRANRRLLEKMKKQRGKNSNPDNSSDPTPPISENPMPD